MLHATSYDRAAAGQMASAREDAQGSRTPSCYCQANAFLCAVLPSSWTKALFEEFIEQVQESNAPPVWGLAKRLKSSRKRPKLASAPILDATASVLSNPSAFVTLWTQLFAEEISNQVVPLSDSQWKILLADKKHSTITVDSNLTQVGHQPSSLPSPLEEWLN